MKNWQRPAAVGQKFAANDYVSACSITVSCDFKTGESLHGGGLVIPEGIGEFSGGEYRPCGQEYVVKVEELKPITFTHFTEGPDDVSLSKSYDAYYWIQADGTDFHATSVSPEVVKDALENGKS